MKPSKLSYDDALLRVQAYLDARAKQANLTRETSEAPYMLGCAEYLLAVVVAGEMSVDRLREWITEGAQ